MPISGRIVDPSSASWCEALSRSRHDFYHLPEYARLCAAEDETPCAFIAEAGEHRFVVPLLLRQLPRLLAGDDETTDATSPYGYPGPVWSRGAPDEFKNESLVLLSKTLQTNHIITVFSRLHPILNRPDDFVGVGDLSPPGSTVYIDLTADEDTLWRKTRGGHRREIRSLERNGYEATIDEEWAHLDSFMLCYHQTMDRVHAKPFYYFPKQYFLDLKMALGDRAKLCLVHYSGEIASAGIFTELDGIGQNHLAATADAHLHTHPAKLMKHFQRTWLKRRGNTVFHLGGGLGGQKDSLYEFKFGFSHQSLPFHTWRLVTDHAKYDTMVQRAADLRGGRALNSEGFFPGYRSGPGES